MNNQLPEQRNLAMLRTVAEKLGRMRSSVVFLGGTILPLLLTSKVAAQVRPAKDVDILIDFKNKNDLLLFEDALWDQGFTHESVGAVSHWHLDDINVDVLDAAPDIVTFPRLWLKEAMLNSTSRVLYGDIDIRIISAPYFMGIKLDAFQNRGRGRYETSRDIYDLLLVLRGCPEIEQLIETQASAALKWYLADEFNRLQPVAKQLLKQPATDKRREKLIRQLEPVVIDRIGRIAAMNDKRRQSAVHARQEAANVQH